MLGRFMIVAFALIGTVMSAAAQTPVTVHGLAYDSLRAIPLRNAFVTLGSRSTTSDSLGAFRFDSVAPGTYRISMLHDVLDSLGLSGTSTSAVVTDGRDTIRVAVPSFGTLWRAACGPTPPSDSGFIFGVVRSASTRRPIRGATVGATWIDVRPDLTGRRLHLEIDSDSTGAYALCGLPTTTGTRIRGATDSLASGFIDLLFTPEWRIQRRDLLLGTMAESDRASRGTIIGMVRAGGNPVPQAVVITDGMPEIRTGASGRFVLQNVPAGTRQIEIRSIGQMAALITVELGAGDTARVNAELQKVTVLAPVTVRANAVRQRMFQDIADRKKATGGYFRDSTEIYAHGTVSTVFRGVPSAVVTERMGDVTIHFRAPTGAGYCLANFWLDGIRTNQEELLFLRPRDIAVVEIYPRNPPLEFQYLRSGQYSCGSVVVWTKRIMP